MTESMDPRVHLPVVNHDDILQALADMLLSSVDTETPWRKFASTQPVLAREVLQRAAFEYPGFDTSSDRAKKQLLDFSSFIVQSIGHAAMRESLVIQKQMPDDTTASVFDTDFDL